MERHQRAATIVTSNRTPDEWLAAMADPLLAQPAVDRLVSTAYELVIEGESYRRRQKPSINHATGASIDQQQGRAALEPGVSRRQTRPAEFGHGDGSRG